MLVTAGIYVLALFATFSNYLLFFSTIITILFVFSLIKNLFPIKYIITWALIFYIGVVNTSIRLRETDILLNLAPVNSEITGIVQSIPQGKTDGKLKFYFDVEKIKFNSIEKNLKDEKVLVTLDYNNQFCPLRSIQ